MSVTRDVPIPGLVPGVDDPMACLATCHARIRDRLDRLHRLVAWLPEHGADQDACRAAAAIVEYFDHAAAQHHENEELDLLPLMIEAADRAERRGLENVADWLQDEHERMASSWEKLRVPLLQIQAGALVPLDAAEVEEFIALYTLHLQREDSELFPRAQRLLDSASLLQLAHRMHARRAAA